MNNARIVHKFNIILAATVLTCHLSVAASAKEKTAPKPVEASNSLAGNYLAARIASTDQDTENASVFYRKALDLDNGNTTLRLQGFLNFIANGDFNEGITVGEELSKGKDSPEIVQLILAVDDLRKKSWTSAEKRLSQPWQSALDRLMAGIVISWVQLGQNKLPEALKTIDDLQGPPWFDLFVQYHGGLVALTGGDNKQATERLTVAFNNKQGGRAASRTYMRVIQALAEAHWKEGNKTEALAMVEEGLKRVPQAPIFERMRENLTAGNAPGFLITSPQRGAAEVFLNLGSAVNQQEGGAQFARIYMQLAKSLAEDDDVVISQLAELFDKQGRLHRAISLFEQIPEESALYQISRLEIALNHDELENFDKASAELEQIIEKTPDDLVAHLSYGAVLAKHEKFDKAAEVYTKIIGRIPNPKRLHWNLYYRRGIAYERTKQWELAEQDFKKSLSLFPNQPNVLNYLGYSWIDMDINLQEGLDMIRTAVKLRPNDGYIVDSLGWAYYKLKRYEEAVVELERAVELRPGDPTINDHLGDAYWLAKRKLEATFQWRHALSLDPPEDDINRVEDKLENGLDAVLKKELAAEEKKNKG